MSAQPTNQTFERQQTKLVRATFKKGFINAVHATALTVDAYLAENPQTILRNIPIARSIDISTIMPQQRCRIDVFDETNPNDCVLAYVY